MAPAVEFAGQGARATQADMGTTEPRRAVKPLTEAQERMVKTLAEHLALAVANLNLRATLRTQSIRDPLTGLFNRRYMEEALDREFRRSVRKGSHLSVLRPAVPG
jgi:PleD family two-component response regulator